MAQRGGEAEFRCVVFGKYINLHRHNESDNLQGLLYIDYGFHVPLMITAIILAYSFISIARGRMGKETPLAQQAAGGPDSVPARRMR